MDIKSLIEDTREILSLNKYNDDDDKKIKRISDVCKESMKYVTMIIKIFVSEYRAAAITCRRILLAGVR